MALVVAVVAAVLGFGAPGRAANPSFIYWSNDLTGRIGRANIDGTGVNQGLIGGASVPAGVAVNAEHVYWTNHRTGTIGRATLGGADVNQGFVTGAHGPYALAVDDGHIYWGSDVDGTIGRANLDGTDPQQKFISGATHVYGIAVDGQHIYWSNGHGGIGRANLDGTKVDQSFIANAPGVRGVAVDSEHVYWAQSGSATIGRANLDGSSVNANFIRTARNPAAVAVANGRIYWSSLDINGIGTASADGTGVLEDLVKGADEGGPVGIAVTGAALPRATVSRTKIEFGTHGLHDFGKPETVTITDTGSAPLAVANATLSGHDADDFLISSDDCSGNVVRPGASCGISVLFGPRSAGTRAATLTITSDDPVSPMIQVALSGTGVQQSTAALTPTELITCKTANTTFTGARDDRVHTHVARCTGKLVPRMGRFTTARAIVSRGSVIDASGSAAKTGQERIVMVLTELRPLRPGRYVLSLRHRQGRRWFDRGLPIRID